MRHSGQNSENEPNLRTQQDVEQDDEFALDEDDDRGDRQRARRAGKAQSGKGKNKGEKDPWCARSLVSNKKTFTASPRPSWFLSFFATICLESVASESQLVDVFLGIDCFTCAFLADWPTVVLLRSIASNHGPIGTRQTALGRKLWGNAKYEEGNNNCEVPDLTRFNYT